MHERRRARLVAYGAAFLSTGLALALRWPLWPVLGDSSPFLTLILAVLLSAYLGGLWPGLLATFLGVAVASYFLIEPRYSFAIADTANVVALVLFVLAGTLMSILSEFLHRARNRLVADERRRPAEELLQEGYLLHTLMENLPDNMYFKDAASRFVRINKALTTYFGLSDPGQALGKTDFDFYAEDHARATHADEQAILQTGQPVVGKEEKEVWLDGRVRWVSTTKMPFRDKDGKIIGTFGVSRDITRVKLAEEELRESEQRWRSLTEALPQLVWAATPDGACDYFSTQWTQHTGVPERDLLGWRWLELLHPDDREPTRQFWLDSVAGRGPYDVEYRVRHQDDIYRWFKTRGVPIRDDAGNIVKWFGTCTDITDLRATEEALRESEERFRNTFENAAVGIAHVDSQYRCLRANGVFCDILGYSRSEAVGRTIPEVVYPEDLPTNLALFDRVVRGDLPSFTMEKRFRRRDARIVWASLIVSLQRDASGQPTYCIVIAQDISERKRLEAELSQAHARLDLAVRGSNIGIWEVDMPDGVLDNARLTINNLWELLGYDRNDGPTTFPDRMALIHPEDEPRLQRAIQTYLSGEAGEFEVEHRNRHKDGSYRWLLTRGVAVRDSAGRPVRFSGSSVDITDLKRAQEALRQSEERFRGTFENAAVGIAHLDAQGYCLRVNEKLADIIGYPQTDLVGMAIPEVVYLEDLAENLALFGPLMSGDIPSFTMEKRLVRKDGSLVWAYLTVSLQRDANPENLGESAYCIAIVQNISERKRLEEELRQAKDAAEAANRAKDEFLANVSHEIRTPMNAILGMTELVLDTLLTEDQRRCLKTVKSGADSLLGMINDLLDFSKIEAGKLELEPADFSLRTAVGDTLRVLAMRAHTKGLELVSQVAPDVPDALVGDAGRLRQVLLNLVGNAIKFTEVGEIVVEIKRGSTDDTDKKSEKILDSSAESSVDLLFSVRDTGIGIAHDKQKSIFRAFEQEDTSTTRKYGGTGLGLTIAARLVALMGGTITVRSEPGHGSTFTFSARFARQAHPSESVAALPPPVLHQLPVLIVDDNATNRHILAEWLRGWRMEPTAVGDGMAALDALWHRAANGLPFALVLLDARMPDTDGLAVAARIRERAELSATRIILLTSGDRPGDPARFRQLRIDAHLLKPVQQEELLETIYQVLQRDEGRRMRDEGVERRPPFDSSSLIPHPSSLQILVAEDNELSAQVLEQLLIRQGHRVRLAGNGREALTLAAAGGFDLLLLDVHMPELDGFQVIQAIREREATATGHLPVIALTARSREADRARCLAAGMDDFLTKPVRPADLWPAIDRVLSLYPPRPAPSLDLLDVPVLLAACGGDATLLGKMCQTLRARVPEHLAALRGALRDQDAPRLREAAHKCCGLLSEFSRVAGDLAGNLEDLAAGAQLDNAPALLEQLETVARELLQQVDGISIETLRNHGEAAD